MSAVNLIIRYTTRSATFDANEGEEITVERIVQLGGGFKTNIARITISGTSTYRGTPYQAKHIIELEGKAAGDLVNNAYTAIQNAQGIYRDTNPAEFKVVITPNFVIAAKLRHGGPEEVPVWTLESTKGDETLVVTLANYSDAETLFDAIYGAAS